jgi:hypothetical protein
MEQVLEAHEYRRSARNEDECQWFPTSAAPSRCPKDCDDANHQHQPTEITESKCRRQSIRLSGPMADWTKPRETSRSERGLCGERDAVTHTKEDRESSRDEGVEGGGKWDLY